MQVTITSLTWSSWLIMSSAMEMVMPKNIKRRQDMDLVMVIVVDSDSHEEWLNKGCASGQCPIQSCGEDGHVPELLEEVAGGRGGGREEP